MAQQNCTMVRRWRIFGDFLRPPFPASRVQHVSDVHPKFALGPHHVWSIADIQCATAENSRGKKIEDKRNHRTKIKCPHLLRTAAINSSDIQDTHNSSAKLHWRSTPAAPLVTTTEVLQSQPAWNSSDENRFHLQCSPHLEHSTSRHHWQLECYSKQFQEETKNVFITLHRIHSLTWPPRLRFRFLMPWPH